MLSTLLPALLLLTTSTFAIPLTPRAVDPSLVPEFGIERGQLSEDGVNCVGANGVLIPCSCPPDRDVFIAKLNEFVDSGTVSFPDGGTAALIFTLQNLNGPGLGCPRASTTWTL
jgi:hypothetical protein